MWYNIWMFEWTIYSIIYSICLIIQSLSNLIFDRSMILSNRIFNNILSLGDKHEDFNIIKAI